MSEHKDLIPYTILSLKLIFLIQIVFLFRYIEIIYLNLLLILLIEMDTFQIKKQKLTS